VKDHGLTTCLVECAKRVKKDRWREYFGSGVMLFDIEKARKENLTDKSCRYLFTQENYKNLYKGLFFEDQDALNAVCIDNVKLLDEKWNSVVRIVILFPLKIDCVIHYAGPDKPWNSTIYLADLWWEYAEKTPFYSDIIIENMRTIVFHKIFVWSSYFCAILIDWLHLGRFVQNFPIILTYLNFVVKKEKMAAYKHLTKFIRSQSQFYFNSCFSFVRKKSNFKSYDHQTTDL
ncbi:MAG: hypothetical protein LBS23_00170, partial [Holosporaceae bacterium]|nr:hypothetical protein [Holosporaceae bacterium]